MDTMIIKGQEFKVQYTIDEVRVFMPDDCEIVAITWVGLREVYGTGRRALDKFIGKVIGNWLAFY